MSPAATLRQSLGFLWHYLRPFRRQVFWLSGLLLAGIGLQLLAPQVLRRFLDMAQVGATGHALTETAVLFLLVVIGQKALSLLSIYVGANLGWAATNRLRADLTAHILHLDMGFHKLHPPGELIERIDGDISTLAEYFSQLVVQVLGNGLLVIGILALQFREDWHFGLIGLTYALTTLFVLRAMQKPTVAIWGRIRQGYADLFGFLEERLNGSEDIRANGGEAYVLARLYPLMGQVSDTRNRMSLLSSATFGLSYLLYVLTWISTLGLGAYTYQQGQLTIGTVFLMAFYIGLLESPLKYIRRQIETLQQAMSSIGRVNEFMQIQPMVQERVTAVLPAIPPTVQFDQVTFTYKDQATYNTNPALTDENVLQTISFDLAAGQILGILGRTGSGKTTLTRLLFRLYDVDSGTIQLNGTDIRHVGLADLRQHVAMVTQDVQLFAATVRDNLTLFRHHDPQAAPIRDAQILEAIDLLGLNEWFRTLPQGLDTLLTTGGQGLSAGEAQLLALIRVFLCHPHLVILDEASSRLDPATEQQLERAIDRLLAGRTAVIIAHRLETVQRADDILILENGRILEHGPRHTLAANPHSRLSNLLRTGLEEVLA